MRQPAHQGFIDKENDRESGLGDFGVRKYECETGGFLSVDALWEVDMRVTPYHYAGLSPFSFVDPSGLTVTVIGKDQATVSTVGETLQEGVSMTVWLEWDGSVSDDRSTAKLYAMGPPATEEDAALLEVIESQDVHVQLDAVATNRVKGHDGKVFALVGGAFDGAPCLIDGTAQSWQFVNVGQLRKMEAVGAGGAGQGILHEIIKGYYGGHFFGGQHISSREAMRAHDEAKKRQPGLPEISVRVNAVAGTVDVTGPLGTMRLYKFDADVK